jgi:hypothetical protein
VVVFRSTAGYVRIRASVEGKEKATDIFFTREAKSKFQQSISFFLFLSDSPAGQYL